MRGEYRGTVGPSQSTCDVVAFVKLQAKGEERRKGTHTGNECHRSGWHSAGYLMNGIKRGSGRRREGGGRKSLAWSRN